MPKPEIQSRIQIRHGVPHIAYGEGEGHVLLPDRYFFPQHGILATADALWNGSVWKVALELPAEDCPDCHGEKCSLCENHGEITAPRVDTIEDWCARETTGYVGHHADDLEAILLIRAIFGFLTGEAYVTPSTPADIVRKCPICQAKKCPKCKGKGSIQKYIWVLLTKLRPMGRPKAIKPGNTIKVKRRVMSGNNVATSRGRDETVWR